jgi:hypothetical protein
VKEDEEMANGISKFRSLLDRMAKVGVKLSEGDKTNVFLSSLPHSWPKLTNINNNKQNLSPQISIGRILQEEQRLKKTIPEAKDTTSALMVGKRKFKFKGKCFKCGKDGHMKGH